MLSDIVAALIVLFQRQNSAPIYQVTPFGRLHEGYTAYLMAICHASETSALHSLISIFLI